MDDMLQNRMNQCLIVQECKNLKNMEKVKSITDFMWAPQLLCSSPGTIELVKHWGTCLTKLYWLTSQIFEKSCKFKRGKTYKRVIPLLSLLIPFGISSWSLILFLIHDLLFQHSPCCLEHCSTCTYKIHGKAIEKWQKQLNVLYHTHSELKFLKWCWFWPQYLWRRR